jgi:hypothetical protein
MTLLPPEECNPNDSTVSLDDDNEELPDIDEEDIPEVDSELETLEER